MPFAIWFVGAETWLTEILRQTQTAYAIVWLRAKAPQPLDHVVEVGELRVDHRTHGVWAHSNPIHLSESEFALLDVMAKRVGIITTYHQLQVAIPAMNAFDVQVCMKHLRELLGDDPLKPHLFFAEPGIGYRFLGPATQPTQV